MFIVIGSDIFLNLEEEFREFEFIKDHCEFVVIYRESTEAIEKNRISKPLTVKLHFLELKGLKGFSSTKIRRRISKKQKVEGMVDPKVYQYILRHRLY